MKIYLAAYETQHRAYGMEVCPNSNLFLTYYYRNITEHTLRHLTERAHQGIITIDSGAHSFFEIMGISVTSKEAKKDVEVPDPDLYFQRYLEWAKEWHEHFDYFCELDLQELVGKEKVDNWREQVNAAGLGHKLITVHHSFNDWNDFEKLCANTKSGYIAIEGIRKGQKILEYNRFLKYAYDRQIKIHGFAFTRSKLLYHFPFYSVDSSSWTTAPRYGILNKFDFTKMKTVKPSKEQFFENQIPLELHNSFKGKEAEKVKLEWAARQYQELEKFFTSLWESRGIKWKD